MSKLTDNDIRALAQIQYADNSGNDIEIDHDAKVSRNDEGQGAFVQAWVWVSFITE